VSVLSFVLTEPFLSMTSAFPLADRIFPFDDLNFMPAPSGLGDTPNPSPKRGKERPDPGRLRPADVLDTRLQHLTCLVSAGPVAGVCVRVLLEFLYWFFGCAVAWIGFFAPLC
jgi:hypothetical protein